jgi:signal recognition particle receptor subunit beta
MREYKIVFTGTMGAGKTTAIAAISETPPVVTDVANNDASLAKAKTTVGLDFGQLTLDTGDRLRLFGTPGRRVLISCGASWRRTRWASSS